MIFSILLASRVLNFLYILVIINTPIKVITGARIDNMVQKVILKGLLEMCKSKIVALYEIKRPVNIFNIFFDATVKNNPAQKIIIAA